MTGYIEVAGLRMWHEVSGAGDPLVLLHGGFVGASSYYAQTPALAEAGSMYPSGEATRTPRTSRVRSATR